VLLLKTDSLGAIQWSKTYGTVGDDGGHRVLVTGDNGYVILGNSSNVGPGVFLIKTGPRGTVEWTKAYSEVGEQILSSLSATADGGYVLSGSTGIYGSLTGYSYLMKTTSGGDLSWCWAFPFGKADLRVHDARQTADGGFITAMNVYRLNPVSPSILVVKTNEQGSTGCFDQQLLAPAVSRPALFVTAPTLPIGRLFLTSTNVEPRVRTIPMPVLDVCSVTGTEEAEETFGEGLLQNYPNPFNPVTIIRYELPKESNVSLRVFNMLGQEVAVLVDEVQAAGHRSVEFNASGLPSGMYLYRLTAGDFVATKKLVLLK
jgi:hypothetical protein